MKKDDREKTVFVSHASLYEYNIMLFGLANVPITFQRLINAMLASLCQQICFVYLDDIIIFAKDFEMYLRHLDKVFKCL